MRVLVTGSRGFVGAWLKRHLEEEGDDVIELPEGTDITVMGVLAEAVESSGAVGIYHLAAQANVSRSWEDPAGTFAANVSGTLNLCRTAERLRPPPRLLLVSSAEVYGHVPPGKMPVGEGEPFAPVTPYAASKASAEMVGLQAFLGRGLPVVRARPFNHTGPGQARGFVVPDLAYQVAQAARGELREITTGNLAVRRDLTDVRDVVKAYRLLLTKGEPGTAYNVCSGQAVVISDLLRRLMELAGADVPVSVDPTRARPADVPVNLGDAGRLKALTGWAPTISLDQTLADVLAALVAGPSGGADVAGPEAPNGSPLPPGRPKS